jgi:hypothetical protein
MANATKTQSKIWEPEIFDLLIRNARDALTLPTITDVEEYVQNQQSSLSF